MLESCMLLIDMVKWIQISILNTSSLKLSWLESGLVSLLVMINS